MRLTVEQVMKNYIIENKEKFIFAEKFASEISNNFSFDEFNKLIAEKKHLEIEQYLKKANENKAPIVALIFMIAKAYFQFNLLDYFQIWWTDYINATEERIGITKPAFLNYVNASRAFIEYGAELRASGWTSMNGISKLAYLPTALKCVKNLDECLQHLKTDTREEFNTWYLSYSAHKKGYSKNKVEEKDGEKRFSIPYPKDLSENDKKLFNQNILALLRCYEEKKIPVVIPMSSKEEAKKLLEKLGI